MISAETYEVLSIISEFTVNLIWALNFIYGIIRDYILVKSPSIANLRALAYISTQDSVLIHRRC